MGVVESTFGEEGRFKVGWVGKSLRWINERERKGCDLNKSCVQYTVVRYYPGSYFHSCQFLLCHDKLSRVNLLLE